MRSATDCAPKRCIYCKHILPPPHVHGGRLSYPSMKWECKYCEELLEIDKICYHNIVITCSNCHAHYVWSWHKTSNGCWKIRSSLLLFDTNEIVEVA
jgi:hypothetical protein